MVKLRPEKPEVLAVTELASGGECYLEHYLPVPGNLHHQTGSLAENTKAAALKFSA